MMGEKFNSVNLIILDGWGVSSRKEGNAIKLAKTPFFDYLINNYPATKISASSDAVGLSWGEAGNSEVGHLNIGAGRVVWQDLPRIDKSISDQSFFENPSFLDAINHVKKNNSKLHLMGIVSPGGVHGHIKHLFALLELAKRQNIKDVFIHAFTDGRDSPPRESPKYFAKLDEKIKEIGVGQVASVVGRYYSMDRNNHWDRTMIAYNAMVYAKGKIANSPQDALTNAYNMGETDEFIEPQIIVGNNLKPLATIQENDAVIFFNYRPDRARQINNVFTNQAFKEFPAYKFKNLFFVAMTQYESAQLIERIAFSPVKLKNTLAEVVATNNLAQFHLAETEKYAHVTYFFNGGIEKTFPKEARAIIPSAKVATYDQKPEMSAEGITQELVKQILSKKFSLNVVNYANCDMVGHTGNLPAAVKAIEYLDKCLSIVIPTTIKVSAATIITADHGNAEEMIEPNKNVIQKEHSSNPVPFILITPTNKKNALPNNQSMEIFETSNPTGILADIAPTILSLLNLPKPPEMDGMNLSETLS